MIHIALLDYGGLVIWGGDHSPLFAAIFAVLEEIPATLRALNICHNYGSSRRCDNQNLRKNLTPLRLYWYDELYWGGYFFRRIICICHESNV